MEEEGVELGADHGTAVGVPAERASGVAQIACERRHVTGRIGEFGDASHDEFVVTSEIVRVRHGHLLRANLDRSFQKDRLGSVTGPELSPHFVLLHTLAHLLIRQLSFESGYTTASLRERIYARPEQDQYGVLVYTAAGDAEGTLGGLVRQGEPPRLAETLLRMTESAAWCSADPLCAEHTGQGFGNLNRAACHACALLPETSCEAGNSLLDRALVIGGERVPGYLQPIVSAARAAAADALEQP